MISTEEPKINKLENKISQLRKRLFLAQARNYDLRYQGAKEPDQAELKARIDWLESEVRRMANERSKP